MDGQALLWFGIAGGALIFAASLLYQRYIKRTPTAVQSRGSFAMFAGLMVFFAACAFVAGMIAAN
ncbi:MAG: hypothetical protein QM589_16585 [Thermomicrobiales bacterium]